MQMIINLSNISFGVIKHIGTGQSKRVCDIVFISMCRLEDLTRVTARKYYICEVDVLFMHFLRND